MDSPSISPPSAGPAMLLARIRARVAQVDAQLDRVHAVATCSHTHVLSGPDPDVTAAASLDVIRSLAADRAAAQDLDALLAELGALLRADQPATRA